MNEGIMVILSSPSGAGKTTLVKLLSERNGFVTSISHTTRTTRSNEVDGKDYHFVNIEKFKKMIDDKDFLELRRSKALNLIYGHFYSFSSIRRLITIYEIIKNNQKSSEQLGKAIFETEEIAELNFNFEAEGEKL